MSCCYELFKVFSVFIVGAQILFGVFRWLYANVIGPNFLDPINLRQFGQWALITGATDGIGKEYAKSLAKRGLNIILVSRTQSKLDDVAKEIRESFTVETETIAVNFTSGPEIYHQIKQQIVGKEIGILVNNVGMCYSVPDQFLNIPDRDKLIQDIIKCNVTSVPMMCSLILPQMVQRKRGLIINISSLSSVIPSPNLSIYAASKAFVTKFSNDLATEYKSHGINIQVLLTGVVCTKLTNAKEAFSIPTANQYVESALSYVGYARHTTGFLSHSLFQFFTQILNFFSPSFFEALMGKRMRAYRDQLIKDPNAQADIKLYF